MKKAVLALAAFALLVFAPAAYAGDNPQQVCNPQVQQCGEWKPRWVPTGEYEWVKKPKYKRAGSYFVKKDCQGACPQQKPEVVNVPPAPPKTVVREQIINVVTVPRIIYQPAPVVNVMPSPCPVANPCQSSMAPCGSPCQQQVVSPCGPRPCQQQNVVQQQLPSHTAAGLNVHAAGTAPQGAKRCQQMVGGQLVSGWCW